MSHRALSIASMACFALFVVGAALAVPPTIPYQGRLIDGTGQPVADGTYTITFRIYAEASDGIPLWLETHEVTTVDGLFTASLGDLVPITGILDGSTRYLCHYMSGQPESTPRIPILSVPYALLAGSVVGGSFDCDWCDGYFINSAGPDIMTATTANAFQVWNGGATARTSIVGGIEAPSSDTVSGVVASAKNTGVGAAYGVRGVAEGLSHDVACGVLGTASSSGSGIVFGGKFQAEDNGEGLRVGVYGGARNWEGAAIAIDAYAFSDLSSRGLRASSTGRETAESRGGDFTAYGIGTGSVYGLNAEALGGSTVPEAYGVRGVASGLTGFAGTNYGGYFQATGETNTLNQYGVYGTASNATTYSSRGVHGVSSHYGSGSSYGGYFISDSTGTGTCYGIRPVGLSKGSAAAYGTASVAANRSTGVVYGGYFEMLNYGTGGGFGIYAKARTTGTPASWAGYFNGNVEVTGTIIGLSTKAAAVKGDDGQYRLFYSQEATESWFEDFGEGQLVNGRARIELDPVFLQAVTVDAANPIKVFIQLNDPDCNGTAVVRGKTGFDVVELMKGTSDASFSYRVVAKRRGSESKRLDVLPGPTPEEVEARLEHDRETLLADEISFERDRETQREAQAREVREREPELSSRMR